jgi:glycosyltransferase involved in cell wall biosynthesis
MKKTTIIIPSFNALPFLKETLESAFNQTYPNIEVIVIDDGSTDGSFEYLQGLDKPNFIVKKNKGKGACAARNYGFELSTGDYIMYLDADDIISPNKIEAQITLFKEFGDDILVSGMWGRFYRTIEDVKWSEQLLNKDYNTPIEWLIDSWMGKGMGQTSIWLAPRKLIEKAGPWDERLTLNDDGEFFSRVILQAKAIKFCDMARIFYRSGLSNSLSQNALLLEKSKSLLLSLNLYEKNSIFYLDNRKVRKALANNYLNFIYQYHSHYPELAKQAEESFYRLNVGKMWAVGGENFKRLAKLVGFKKALKLKKN